MFVNNIYQNNSTIHSSCWSISLSWLLNTVFPSWTKFPLTQCLPPRSFLPFKIVVDNLWVPEHSRSSMAHSSILYEVYITQQEMCWKILQQIRERGSHLWVIQSLCFTCLGPESIYCPRVSYFCIPSLSKRITGDPYVSLPDFLIY